jgi:hypothetical protein
MIMKHAKTVLRMPPVRDQGSSELDPETLSTTLRELALRAHQLVRTSDGSGPGTESSEDELSEVHAQIVRLQRNLGSHELEDLATYVTALRERVEECLA